ncbi:periplasmic binding protein and sugar binding domain of the LacI family protein [Asticcacaulis biprosthecium C19]|uniref:Periplasmic binding protein and sugar binding domain of the LacI family protein n=1 Tax=Asticcacaulis biprosthecium C19 TaxID=715226 RepID=F4QK94_9CAUL|nr:LacI family DNA-binding transcriptional regulator [Asticcacaulis biprosthecium]EGF93272.1 periplasmic binding protein and sugar binding domain of the LacI family protein [Asticcacaulis biprosthecium C19]
MSDIAKMAGVSLSSVSRALGGSSLVPEPQRQRILDLAEAHGYSVNQAARNLRLRTTETIGLVLPMGHETGQKVTDPFLLELIGNLSEEVFHRGYDMLMSKNPAPRTGWLKSLVQSHRFDAMLVLGQSDQHDNINALAANYAPMVVWGERLPHQAYCSVGVDNALGGTLATEHLLSRGRRQILFLGPAQVPEVASRLRGYVEALTDFGLPPKPNQIIDAHFTYESAYETVCALLASRRKFDAIFAASDVIAVAAITALTKTGRRVPEDVAVCGFDDVAMARTMAPSLTTVRQDLRMGAQLMVDLLFRRMNGEKTTSAVIPASLIERAST